MEPRIRYAKTSDGVSIAYATAGEGTCLVFMPSPPMSHVQRQWHMFNHVMRPLAQTFHLAWYDSRGSGLSDRKATDFSMDAMVRDLEAVAGRAAPGKFALLASYDAVPIAITYAAANAERLSHLMLIDGWTKIADYYENPAYVAEEALRGGDWLLYTETFARVLIGFEDQVFAAQYAEHIRTCVDADAFRVAMQSMQDYDVIDLLGHVRTPTLVAHNQNNRFLPVQSGQRIAAGIPDARFAVIDDIAYQNLPELIQEFIGQATSANAETSHLPSGTAIILFADIVDSTAITERVGDSAFRNKTRHLDGTLRTIIRDNAGIPVEGKLLGDGVLAVFTSARQAIEAALACGKASEEGGLPLHLGLHAGDVIREENNVYGGAVNIASRISALSAPGEVLVSRTVADLARTSAGVSFEDRGEHELKGVAEPQRLFAVQVLD